MILENGKYVEPELKALAENWENSMTKIKVCADPFPPYQYVDKDGSIKGKEL